MSVIGKATILLEVNAVGLQDSLKKSGDTWSDFTDRALAGTKRLDSDFDRYISSIQQKIDRIGKSADQIDLGKFIKLGATDDQISRIQKLQDLYNTRATTEAKYQEMLRDTKQAQTAAAEAVVASIAKVRQARSEAMKGVGSGLQSDLAGHDASLGSIDPFANFENQSKLLELAKKQQADAMKGVGAGLAGDLAGHDARIGSFDPFTKFVDQTKLKEAAAKKAKEATDAQRAAEERLTKSHAEEEKALKKQLATMEMSATKKKEWELKHESGFSDAQIKKLMPTLDAIGTKEKRLAEAQGLSLSRQASLLRNASMGVGRFQELGVAFGDEGGHGPEKAARGIQEIVGSMSSGLRVMSNLGIGGARGMIGGLAIGGSLVGMGIAMAGRRRQEEREDDLRSQLDDDVSKRLTRLTGRTGLTDAKFVGGPGGLGGAETLDSEWARTARDVERYSPLISDGIMSVGRFAHSIGLAGDPDAAKVSFSAFTVDAIKASKALREMATSSHDTSIAMGRSALLMGSEASIRRFRAETGAATAAGRFGTPEEVTAHRLLASGAALDASLAAIGDINAATTERVLALDRERTSSRDAAATTGMMAAAADRYRASMVTTTRVVDGTTMATTESLSPAELYARRLSEIRARYAILGGGMLMRTAMGTEIAAAGFERDRRGRAIEDAVRAGVFGRGVATAFGARTSAEVEMRRIDELRADLAGGGLGAGATGRSIFRRLLEPAEGSFRTPAETVARTMESVERRMTAAGMSGRFGERVDISRFRAEAAAAVEVVTGDMRSPLEAARGRLGALDAAAASAGSFERAADMLRLFVGGALPAGVLDPRVAIDRARARTYMDLAASAGSLDMPAGVAAMNMGSVEAYRAINAAQRAGPTDPVERTAAGIARLVEIEGRRAADEVRVLEAVRAGVIVLPPAGLPGGF